MITIKHVSGDFDRPLRALRKVPARLVERLQARARGVADRIRQDAPVRTGQLKGSVRVHDTANGAVVTVSAPHAKPVASKRRTGRSFLTRAAKLAYRRKLAGGAKGLLNG